MWCCLDGDARAGGGSLLELMICWLGDEALWACLFCFVAHFGRGRGVGGVMGGSHCVSKNISRFIYGPGCKSSLLGGGGAYAGGGWVGRTIICWASVVAVVLVGLRRIRLCDAARALVDVRK